MRMMISMMAAFAMCAVVTNSMTYKFATFNGSMNRRSRGQLITDLSDPKSEESGTIQAKIIAEIIQINAPDVLVLLEFDYDSEEEDGTSTSLRLFKENFLSVSQNGQTPIDYPYMYSPPSNTGIPSGRDFNGDGRIDSCCNDAFGFGFFPGQFAFAIYSKYEIEYDNIRTFQNFLWKDMPASLLMEVKNEDGALFYDEGDMEIFRLSSKNHADIPVKIGDETVHFLVSHPTLPVFDGPVDANGKRNHDEIRFWADYIDGAAYMYDDNGMFGGLPKGSLFAISGELNADPLDGDSFDGAANLVLDHPLVNAQNPPSSEGAVEQAILQGGINGEHLGDPSFDTVDFAEPSDNLRVDYMLPSYQIDIVDSFVFWPKSDDPNFDRLVGVFPFPGSDHKLVSVSVKLSPSFPDVLAGEKKLSTLSSVASGHRHLIKKSPSLLDVLAGERKLSTLAGIISEYPVVVEALMTSDFPTLFAPTNKAFDALMMNEDLRVSRYAPDNMWSSHLLDLLAYHSLPELIMSSDILDDSEAGTANGEKVTFNINKKGAIRLNKEARVLEADLEAKNGVVHIINSVLLPESVTTTILEHALQYPNFSTLLDLAFAAGLESLLSGDEPITIFAPNNDAFSRLDPSFIASLHENKEMLTKVLTYHAVPGIFSFSDLSDGLELETISGCKVTVVVDESGFFRIKESVNTDGAFFLSVNLFSSNGVTHVVGDVLIPPASCP